jgi:CRP-like cAMP-binding protein
MSGIPAGIQAYSQDDEQNRVLRALPPSSYSRLRPYLEPVTFSLKQVLWNPDDAIESVYFPRTSSLSLIVSLARGGLVEAATVGNEGIVGMAAALGKERASMLALAQIPGHAARMCSSVFRGLVEDDASVRMMTLRCSHALLEQAAQSAACNARHSIGQRCARWILMTHDRARADEFPMTHEMLAIMLGSPRRPSVTNAALELQRSGLVSYKRGRLTVKDRPGLEEAACECYRTVETRLQRIFGSDKSPQAH